MKFRKFNKPKSIKIGAIYYIDFKDPNIEYQDLIFRGKGKVIKQNDAFTQQYSGPNWYTVKLLSGPESGASIWIDRKSFKYEIKS